jgi:hypothetical protein
VFSDLGPSSGGLSIVNGDNSVKFISAQQAKATYHHHNIRKKLLKTNAAIWFNKNVLVLVVFDNIETP